jgi:CHAD domain-containing protein
MARPTPVRGLVAATPMSRAAQITLRGRSGDLRRHLAKLRRSLQSDTIHDARVSSRRLRGALTLFGDRGRVRRADVAVTDLQDALGELRDLQVQLEAFAALERRVPAEEHESLQRIAAMLRGAVPANVVAVRKAIDRWNRRGPPALARLQSLRPRGRLGGHRLRKRLVRQLEALEERVIDAQQRPTPRPMHLLRIAVKRFRYALELLQPAMPELDEIGAALVRLQTGLGDLHDIDVRSDLIDLHTAGGTRAADGLLRLLRGDRERLAQTVLRALESWEEEATALRAQVLLSASPLKPPTAPRSANRR